MHKTQQQKAELLEILESEGIEDHDAYLLALAAVSIWTESQVAAATQTLSENTKQSAKVTFQ